MKLTFLNLSFAEKLLVLSLIIWVGTGLVSPFFTQVFRVYETSEGLFDYTIGDLIYYLGQSLAAMLFFWFARIKVKHSKLPRCMTQWVIDLSTIEIIYELYSNPYVWNKSKLIMYSIATGIFIVVYYFDYISLWHQYWVDKIKTFYHEHFKNKHNGRKS